MALLARQTRCAIADDVSLTHQRGAGRRGLGDRLRRRLPAKGGRGDGLPGAEVLLHLRLGDPKYVKSRPKLFSRGISATQPLHENASAAFLPIPINAVTYKSNVALHACWLDRF